MSLILWPPLVKATSWIQWLPCILIVGLLLWATSSLPPNFASRQVYIRAALLVAALGLSFTYDDAMADVASPTPTSLRVRRTIRTLIGLIPWCALVVVTIVVAGRGLVVMFLLPTELPSNVFPVGQVLLEASTMAVVGLTAAAVAANRWDLEPGRYVSAGLVVLYTATWAVPEQWRPWATPEEPRWGTVALWWLFTFGVTAVFAVAVSWDSRVRR